MYSCTHKATVGVIYNIALQALVTEIGSTDTHLQ